MTWPLPEKLCASVCGTVHMKATYATYTNRLSREWLHIIESPLAINSLYAELLVQRSKVTAYPEAERGSQDSRIPRLFLGFFLP